MRTELCFFLALVLVGCGENQDTTSPSIQFGPPENLKALSANGSTVRLQWTAPSGQPDSLGGFVVHVGASRDTLLKSALSYTADSLTPGEKTFIVYARRKSGALSDGAIVKWAPAARFEGPYVLTEYKTNVTSVNSAIDVGTATLDPAAMAVTLSNASRMDVYLFGGNGGVQESMQLQSTSMLANVYNATYFSTVNHSSTSLDYFLGAFPESQTFTLTAVPVVDNTIYYVKVVGDNGSAYARIHVHVPAGTGFPSRTVEIRVSLQRVSGVLYALTDDEGIQLRTLPERFSLPGVRI